MSEIPATIDVNPKGNDPDSAVIWLHGLGAEGNDFVPMVEQLPLLPHNVRFVFPHAPIRAITVNGGMKMRAWYDISELNLETKEDKHGIQSSEKLIRLLIEREEARGIPADRIVLGGFSQGGAMSLYTALRYPKKLAAVLSLSAYLPLAMAASTEKTAENQNTPIFIAHGLFDPIVPLMMGELCKQQLQNMGYDIEWHTYPMSHSVLPEEIQDIAGFLQRVL